MGLNKDDVVFKNGSLVIGLDKDGKIAGAVFQTTGALKVRDSSGVEVGEMEPQNSKIRIKVSSLPKFSQTKLNALVNQGKVKLAEKFGAAVPAEEFDFSA